MFNLIKVIDKGPGIFVKLFLEIPTYATCNLLCFDDSLNLLLSQKIKLGSNKSRHSWSQSLFTIVINFSFGGLVLFSILSGHLLNRCNRFLYLHTASHSMKSVQIGVFSSPYFPAFGPEKTPYLDTFHAVSGT